ncbi:MAG: GAF domain-containing protein [Planctomycetales bacterium]
MPILEILKGARAGQQCELNGEEVVVGRLADCDIVLPDETVSRQHARFSRGPDGWYVEDLQSRNGTFVNGNRVDRPTRLRSHDCIMLYDLPLRYWETSPEAPSRTRPAEPHFAAAGAAGARSLDAPVTFETVAEFDIREILGPASGVRPETKLQAVLQITRDLRRSMDLEQILPRILDTVFRVFPQADRCYILQTPPGDETRLVPSAVKQRDGAPSAATLRPITRAIAQQVMTSGKAILSSEPIAAGDPDASIFDAPMRSIMSAPLLGPSRNPTGIIWVDTGASEQPFDRDDLDLLACVGILAGQAVEYASREGVRYRAVVNTAADGIITIDDRGTIESVNPAVERLFGFEQAELVGGSVGRLIPFLEEVATTGGRSSDVETGEAPAAGVGREVVGRRKDGSEFPMHLSLGEFELDGRRCFTAIVQDITARKGAEEALLRLNETLELRVEQRTGYVKLLQDVAVIANKADTVEEAFAETLDRIRRFMHWPAGHVFVLAEPARDAFVDSGIWSLQSGHRFEELQNASAAHEFLPGIGLVGRILESRRAIWISSLADDPSFTRTAEAAAAGIHGLMAFPILLGEDVVAVFEFFSSEPEPANDALLEVMAHVGTQLSRVVERRKLQAELIDAVWRQQRQFGQELHDCLGQELTGIRMMAESVKWRLESRAAPEAALAEELIGLIREAHHGVRQLSKGLFPVEVFAHGLMSALEELADQVARQCDVDCRFECAEPVDVKGNETATHLFRIAQEAANNAVNHGRAEHIRISLEADDGRVALRVADDGVGIGRTRQGGPEGMGLRIMRYRANVMDAKLTIEPGPQCGTVVTCLVEPRHEHESH